MSTAAMKPLIVPAKGKHTATMIVVHGLGDSGAGWSFLPQELKNPSWIKFVFPNAPNQPVTINGGMRMPSWYDIAELGGDANERVQDEKGMLASARTITDLLAAEVDAGIPADRVILAGFSQGAVVSTLAGLTSERKVAGIVALSGYMPMADKIVSMATDHARKLPFFGGHGTADQVVPYKWAQRSWEVLQTKLKMQDLRLETYPEMGHASCAKEMKDLREFIDRVMPEQPESPQGKM